MPQAIPYIVLAVTVASAGTQAYQTGAAGRKAEHAREDDLARAERYREEETSYISEAQRRADEEAEARYQAELKDYETKKTFYESLVADPSLHPEYAPWKEALGRSYEQKETRLRKALEARNITGGEMTNVLRELAREEQTTLATGIEKIRGAARESLAGLATPVKGQPTASGVQTPGTGYTGSSAVQAPVVDLSGFGQGMGSLAGYLLTADKAPGTDFAGTLAEGGTAASSESFASLLQQESIYNFTL